MGNEHKLVEDVDPQSLIKLVKLLKKGKGSAIIYRKGGFGNF